MKTTTKTIICGLAAFALYACSSDNTASPDTTNTEKTAVENGSEDGTKQIRLEPSVDEAYLESILNGESIDNMVSVDPPICPDETTDDPDDYYWCPPYRVQLETGTVFHRWDGLGEVIFCETEQDTMWYSVYLNHNIITKKWHNPQFLPDDVNKAEFRDSCITEGGKITEDTEDQIICEFTIKPFNTDKEYTPPPEGELSMEFLFVYENLNWKLFATKAIEPCRIHPQIEPVADK